MSRDLRQGQQNIILNLFLNGIMDFKKIAKKAQTSSEQVYEFIDKYCKENGYQSIIITKDGAFKKSKSLIKVEEIEKWINQNKRSPRQYIRGVSGAKKGEEETEEQKELRLGWALRRFNNGIIARYEGKRIEEINNYQHREIVRIIRGLSGRYTHVSNKLLMKVQELQEWANENGRRPRKKILGVIAAKDGEEETEEQKELRLGVLLNDLTELVNKYQNIDIEDIEDYRDKEIVRIIRELTNKYEKNKVGMNKKTSISGTQELSTALLNLSETRNATENQIRILANYYGVDLEKIGLSQRDDSESIEYE